jgi:hypothetical protein
MPDNRQQMVNEVAVALGSVVAPSLTSKSAASDLFEAFVFSIVIGAARTEGAQVAYETVRGTSPSQFIFRTSPGYIYSTEQDYTHAILSFAGTPELEVHVGVRFSGRSRVLHECDVAVVDRAEAITCRINRVPPRHTHVWLVFECKFYTTSLPLGLGRSFMGLDVDFSQKHHRCYFVANTSSDSLQRFLAHHKRNWECGVEPGRVIAVDRLRNEIQNWVKNYIAIA